MNIIKKQQYPQNSSNKRSSLAAMVKRGVLTFSIAAASTLSLGAQDRDVVFVDEKNDTTTITAILIKEAGMKDAPNVVRIAENFIGTPYAAGTLEGKPEILRVNLQGMDCTTFVETVLALAYTAGEKRQSWRDFVYNLRRMRYRNGETNGYGSRLHYVSDWILDNTSRGNLKEKTSEFTPVRYAVKTLDYMTRHRDSYPALTDSLNYADMKRVESGFSNFRYPYIKASSLSKKNLKQMLHDGDVVCFTTNMSGLDVTHMGIVKYIGDTPHMIHASTKEGKVILDQLPISEYIRRNRNDGIRILKLHID